MQVKHGGVNNDEKMGRKGVSYDKQTLKRKRMLDNRVYASEEARKYAKERAEEIQSGLDSKYPSFLKSMSQSHVTGGFWLGLPTNLCTKYLPGEDTRFSLIDENLKESSSLYLAKRTGLSAGWRGFAIEHGLVDGDAVVFHLIKPTAFNVYIVRSGDFSSGVEENNKNNNNMYEAKTALPREERQPLKTMKNESSCSSSSLDVLRYANRKRTATFVINSDEISCDEDHVHHSDKRSRKEMEKKAEGVQSELDQVFPSFIKLMEHPKGAKSWLELPPSFCGENLPKENTKMILIDENLNSFKTVFIIGTAGEGLLTLGWQEFCTFHGLVEDDALILHLVNPTTFKAYILRAKANFTATDPNDKISKIEENSDKDQESESWPLMEEPSTGRLPSSGISDYSCGICVKLKEELKQKTMEADRATEKLHSFKSCKVCMERDTAMLLLPCMHLCLCKNCEPRFHVCPICNTGKVSSVQIFMS